MLLHPQCSCGWVLRWVWASGMCLFTAPLLHGCAKPSLLHSHQVHEILLMCSDSSHFCPGWRQVQLAIILTQPFSLSLEGHFLELVFIKTFCYMLPVPCYCSVPALQTPCLGLDHHHPRCPRSSQCLSQIRLNKPELKPKAPTKWRVPILPSEEPSRLLILTSSLRHSHVG